MNRGPFGTNATVGLLVKALLLVTNRAVFIKNRLQLFLVTQS